MFLKSVKIITALLHRWSSVVASYLLSDWLHRDPVKKREVVIGSFSSRSNPLDVVRASERVSAWVCVRALWSLLELFLSQRVSSSFLFFPQKGSGGAADVLTSQERLYHGEPGSALRVVTLKPHRSHVELHRRFPALGLPHFDVLVWGERERETIWPDRYFWSRALPKAFENSNSKLSNGWFWCLWKNSVVFSDSLSLIN